jgi:hypothetical protein
MEVEVLVKEERRGRRGRRRGRRERRMEADGWIDAMRCYDDDELDLYCTMSCLHLPCLCGWHFPPSSKLE